MKAKTWAVLIFLSLCAVLLVQNMEVVSFHIFFWKISMSRVIAFPLLLLVGFLFGYFLGKFGGIGAKGRKR